MTEPHVWAYARPLIIFMDDVTRSIAPQIALAKRLGFDVKVFERLLQLGNHLGELEDDDEADRLAAMVLDMHMPKERTLEAVKLPDVKTGDGEAVGLAVAERFLRDGDTPFSEVPVAFLTGRPIQPPILERIAKLSEDENDAVVVHKHSEHDSPVLEAFLNAAGEKQQRAVAKTAKVKKATKRSAIQRPSPAWVEIATAARIVWEMFEDPAQRAGAFGFRSTRMAEVADLERFATEYPSIDLADRATLIIDMKMRLDALSEQRLDVERKWLAMKPASLKGERPVDLICNGHLHDLKRVVGALRLVTG